MKMNDETDAAYIVRKLRDNYQAAVALETEARLKREAAFDAFILAERIHDRVILAKKNATGELK